jgi:hypothetical protein
MIKLPMSGRYFWKDAIPSERVINYALLNFECSRRRVDVVDWERSSSDCCAANSDCRPTVFQVLYYFLAVSMVLLST